MAKPIVPGRSAATESKNKSAKVSALRLEAERKQAHLLSLRENARKAVKEPALPPNLLADSLGGTLENVRAVMRFLECNELVENSTTAEAEEGRWRIQQLVNDALEYAQAHLERERKIDAAVIAALQAEPRS